MRKGGDSLLALEIDKNVVQKVITELYQSMILKTFLWEGYSVGGKPGTLISLKL